MIKQITKQTQRHGSCSDNYPVSQSQDIPILQEPLMVDNDTIYILEVTT